MDVWDWYSGLPMEVPPGENDFRTYLQNPPGSVGPSPSEVREKLKNEGLPVPSANGHCEPKRNEDDGKPEPERKPLTPDEKADPFEEPDRIVVRGNWTATRSKSVVPGGDLREIIPRDQTTLRWRTAALDAESGLSSYERLLVCVLADSMKACGSSCFPSQRTIAAKANLGRKTVRKYLNRLRDKGWLAWLDRVREDGSDTSRVFVPGVPEGTFEPGLSEEIRAELDQE